MTTANFKEGVYTPLDPSERKKYVNIIENNHLEQEIEKHLKKPNNIEKEKTALDIQIDGDHYKQFKIQPIEFCQKNRLPQCESNVIKYICRHNFKGGLKDLEKAKHCIDLLIQMEY